MTPEPSHIDPNLTSDRPKNGLKIMLWHCVPEQQRVWWPGFGTPDGSRTDHGPILDRPRMGPGLIPDRHWTELSPDRRRTGPRPFPDRPETGRKPTLDRTRAGPGATPDRPQTGPGPAPYHSGVTTDRSQTGPRPTLDRPGPTLDAGLGFVCILKKVDPPDQFKSTPTCVHKMML